MDVVEEKNPSRRRWRGDNTGLTSKDLDDDLGVGLPATDVRGRGECLVELDNVFSDDREDKAGRIICEVICEAIIAATLRGRLDSSTDESAVETSFSDREREADTEGIEGEGEASRGSMGRDRVSFQPIKDEKYMHE